MVYLIRQREEQAAIIARELIARAKTEILDVALRTDVVELIETIIIYKLPKLSREEIQIMLQVHDIRETRVYQEARHEGLQEGIEMGIEKGIEKGIESERQRIWQEKIDAISKLAARQMTAAEIADVLKLELDLVLKSLSKSSQ